MANYADLIPADVLKQLLADPNSSKLLSAVPRGQQINQPDFVSLDRTNEDGTYQPLWQGGTKRIFNEGEFADSARWQPGAMEAALKNAYYDPKYGLIYDQSAVEPYWIPRQYSGFSNFMEKAIPAVAGGLMLGGATGLFGSGTGSASAAGSGAAGSGAAAPAYTAGAYGGGLGELGNLGYTGLNAAIPGVSTGVLPGAGITGLAGIGAGAAGAAGAGAAGSSLWDKIKSGASSILPGGGNSSGGDMNLSDWLNIGSALAGAGASIYGAKQNAGAAQDAANTQAQGQADAIAELRRQFDLSRSDQMPWLQAGQGSLSQLSALMAPGGQLNRQYTLADFQADPGYQFQLGEGEQAINRAAASRGGYNSGRTLKELMRFNQGLADTTYNQAYNRYNTDQNNLYNRLAGIAGTGQNAAQNLATGGANYAGNVANTLTSGANAQAASQIAGANARTSGYAGAANALAGGLQNYQQNQLLSKLLPKLFG